MISTHSLRILSINSITTGWSIWKSEGMSSYIILFLICKIHMCVYLYICQVQRFHFGRYKLYPKLKKEKETQRLIGQNSFVGPLAFVVHLLHFPKSYQDLPSISELPPTPSSRHHCSVHWHLKLPSLHLRQNSNWSQHRKLITFPAQLWVEVQDLEPLGQPWPYWWALHQPSPLVPFFRSLKKPRKKMAIWGCGHKEVDEFTDPWTRNPKGKPKKSSNHTENEMGYVS